jgi:hypothetical protein
MNILAKACPFILNRTTYISSTNPQSTPVSGNRHTNIMALTTFRFSLQVSKFWRKYRNFQKLA